LKISFILNGEKRELETAPGATLLEVLKGQKLCSPRLGCGRGNCGACTVIVDGKAVSSCLMLAFQADGREVLTVEGLSKGDELHPLQRAFIEKGAPQCGYCTSGMLMSAKALLDKNPDPGEMEIRTAISGNLCRCTGYNKYVEAIAYAAELMEDCKG
jgi:carbon-monoxide dehydrogenase small subunit